MPGTPYPPHPDDEPPSRLERGQLPAVVLAMSTLDEPRGPAADGIPDLTKRDAALHRMLAGDWAGDPAVRRDPGSRPSC